MKLSVLGFPLVFATLSLGQSSLQIQSPSGAVRLSANSISGAVDSGRPDLRRQLASLREQLAQLSSTYTPKHPKVQAVEMQINTVDTALRMEAAGMGNLIQLKGNVKIETDTMALVAEEADYNTSTGEIETRGTVRIKLISK